jgi:hypothetical protein
MLKPLSTFGLTSCCALGVAIFTTAVAHAVPPVSMSQNAKVEWSQVIDDRFDGKLVYDKNFSPNGNFEFISRWSPQGIQATYTESWTETVGYRTVWRSKWVKENGKNREVRYRDQEPITQRYRRDRNPKQIKFALHDQIFVYEGGAVPADLANALATAPDGNLTIRLVWNDDSTSDMAIGKGTVEAWKTVFRRDRPITIR